MKGPEKSSNGNITLGDMTDPDSEKVVVYEKVVKYFGLFVDNLEEYEAYAIDALSYIVYSKGEYDNTKWLRYIIDCLLIYDDMDDLEKRKTSFMDLHLRQVAHTLIMNVRYNRQSTWDQVYNLIQLEELFIIIKILAFYRVEEFFELCVDHMYQLFMSLSLNEIVAMTQRQQSSSSSTVTTKRDIPFNNQHDLSPVTPHYNREKNIFDCLVSYGLATTIPGVDGKIPAFVNLVTAGADHTIVQIPGKKNLYGSGSNDNGQLGANDTYLHEFEPIFPALENETIIMVACGESHTVVLTESGLWGCGLNDRFQLGIPHYEPTTEEIFEQDEDLLSYDKYHEYDIKTIRRLDVEGNIKGEILSIACENVATYVLSSQGLYKCGYESTKGFVHDNEDSHIKSFTKIEFFVNPSNICKVSCGSFHTAVLQRDGTLHAFGNNVFGQLPTTSTTNVKKFDHTVTNNVSYVWCGSQHTIIASSENIYTENKKKYHEVTYYGDKNPSPYDIGSRDPDPVNRVIKLPCLLTEINQMSTMYHSVLSTVRDDLYTYGANDSTHLEWQKQVSVKTEEKQNKKEEKEEESFKMLVNTNVSPTNSIISVVCGKLNTFVLTTNGLFVCGNNSHSQLGVGFGTSSVEEFVKVESLPEFNFDIFFDTISDDSQRPIKKRKHKESLTTTDESIFDCKQMNQFKCVACMANTVHVDTRTLTPSCSWYCSIVSSKTSQ